jgi:undecaprenyl-phosphate galactose phosphotransferase/exopolysaccharide production protein ExoY
MLNAGQLNERFPGTPHAAGHSARLSGLADMRFAPGQAERRRTELADQALRVRLTAEAPAAATTASVAAIAVSSAPASSHAFRAETLFREPAEALFGDQPAARPSLPVEPRALPVHSASQRLAKRLFDIAFAVCFLLVAAPVLVLLALAVKLDSPGPLFFVQQRVGRGGKMFGCIKLRTMRVDADVVLAHLLATCPASRAEWAADHKLRNDPRVSRLGRLLRKLSLDELPQLINVLRGEMSIVGPRPIVQAEVVRYGAAFADYCAVKPGLTGLWQVSGRNDVTYAQRVSLDSEYRRRASFAFDLRIVLRTIPAVLGAHGSY